MVVPRTRPSRPGVAGHLARLSPTTQGGCTVHMAPVGAPAGAEEVGATATVMTRPLDADTR